MDFPTLNLIKITPSFVSTSMCRDCKSSVTIFILIFYTNRLHLFFFKSYQIYSQIHRFVYQFILVQKIIFSLPIYLDLRLFSTIIFMCMISCLQNSREEVIAATAYLELFLRKTTEPNLLRTFLKFILVEQNDEIVILDSLITRINSSSKVKIMNIH